MYIVHSGFIVFFYDFYEIPHPQRQEKGSINKYILKRPHRSITMSETTGE